VDFLDTNIIVYANDPRDRKKQTACANIVAAALDTHSAAVSTQVLFEFANVALSKYRMDAKSVRRQLELLSRLHVVRQSPALAIRATEVREIYGVSFWDAAIVAAAEEAGCSRIISEDMNAGQIYCGMRMVNPFMASPIT
jgi:predicted nucleic acid-binding protein